jgi:hypothetical protein
MKNTILLIASLLVCLQSVAVSEEVLLASSGAPQVYLVLDDRLDDQIVETVDDLVAVIERATGAVIPRAPRAGLIPLYIGEPNDFPALSVAVPDLEEEACFIRVSKDAIHILGGSALGTRHGVYTLLHDAGCRWIMPGAIGECFPEGDTLSLPVGKRISAPDFRYRKLSCGGGTPETARRFRVWERRNRLYAPDVRHGHNLTSTLARLASYEERPELYALLQGERKDTQVCTSNPEAVALIIESIAAYLDEHPEMESYSLCPDDNFDFCECKPCRALDVGHMDRGGMPSIADRYQVFLNQVLEGLAERHPSALVTTYSYNPNHTDPPQRTPVHPNTAIFCAPNIFCSIHGVGDAQCASQQDLHALLSEWRALTEHVYLFEYDPEPYCGGLPWPLWRAHAGAYPRYKEMGVKGVFIAGQASWAPYFLSYHVAAQMLWDSSVDAEALYADILRDFFGDAAPEMRRYFDGLESHFRAFTGTAIWGMEDYPKYFSREAVERARAALDAADKKQVPDLIRQRLDMTRLSFEVFDAYLGIRGADSKATFTEYKADMERLEGTINRMHALNEDFLWSEYARKKTGIALSERFAREQGFVNRWLLCGPFDNLGMDGHDRVYTPEETIDLAATYPGKNGNTVGWRPNTTPDGQAYVDLKAEYEFKDWVCAYALCWVTNDGDAKDVLFRVGSNDSVKVFLNGEEVWNHKAERVASVDDDLVPVTLPSGVSTVMLKIGQASYSWGLYFRISELDSTDMPAGITVSQAPAHGN